jgi:hypothetical protein
VRNVASRVIQKEMKAINFNKKEKNQQKIIFSFKTTNNNKAINKN